MVASCKLPFGRPNRSLLLIENYPVNLPSPARKRHFLLWVYPELFLVLALVLVIEKLEFGDEEENEDDYDTLFFQMTRLPTTEMSPLAIAATHRG